MKHLTILTLSALMLLCTGCANKYAGTASNYAIPANKKAIMDDFVAGKLPSSYVPAAFFAHFPGPKQGEGAVRSHLDFYLRGNADILKVQFEQSAPNIRDYEKQETWDNIKPIPEDFYRPTLEVVKGIQAIAGKDVYVLPTIYSPFQVAFHALKEKGVRYAAVNRPDDLKRLLDNYATALKWLVRECKNAGIEGFYMTCQGGEKKYYNIPDFYKNFVRPYDLEVMNYCAEGTKMNMLHICDWEGVYDDLTRYADYPGHIINTPIDLDGTIVTMKDAVKMFGGRPVLGGLERKGIIISGKAEDVAKASAKAIADGPAGKMMLGAECTVSSAPMENIHTAIATAHRGGK